MGVYIYKLFPPLFGILMLLCSSVSFARCQYPDLSDPDEMMDNIGRTQFCDSNDPTSPPVREDLGGGNVSSPIGAGDDGGRGVAIGTGGITYVIGRSHNGSNNDFGLIKYWADGYLDTSFHTDGKILITFGNGDDTGHAILIQTDSRLILIGRSDKGAADSYDFAIARVHTNGTMDTSFNSTGNAFIDFGNGADIPRSGIIDSSGRILLGGYTKPTAYQFAFGRLNTDGSIDTTFNTAGKLNLTVGTSDAGAISIELDKLGRLIAGGNAYNGSNWDWAAARVNSDGTVDTTFNTVGSLTFPIGTAAESSYAVVSDNSNRMILAGSSVNATPNLDFALARLETNGTFDTGFGTTGKKTHGIAATDEGFNAVGMETNGLTILGAGYYYNGSNNDFAVLRFMSNGTLDTSFSTSGVHTKAIRAGEDTIQSLYTKMPGVIMVAGRTYNGANIDYAIERLQSDGSLALSGTQVRSFGTEGIYTLDIFGSDYGKGIASDRESRILLLGNSGNNTSDAVVARLTLGGVLDTAFATKGFREYDYGAGDIALTGYEQENSSFIVTGVSGNTMFIHRVMTNGSIDTSFSTDGYLVTTHSSGNDANIYGQTDGKSLIVTFNSTANFFVMRYETDGTLDTSFNTTGFRSQDIAGGTLDYSYAAVVMGDSRILVGGNSGVVTQTGLMRLLSNGALDTTFATDGIYSAALTTSGKDNPSRGQLIDLDPLNRILVRMYGDGGSGGERGQYVFRFNSSGGLDTSFASDGTLRYHSNLNSNVGSIVPIPSGKMYAVVGPLNALHMYRFHTSSDLDTAFFTSGSRIVTNGQSTTNSIVMPNGWVCSSAAWMVQELTVICHWQ